MFKIWDVSMPVSTNMTVYKNKESKKPEFQIIRDFTDGNIRETRVCLDVHSGTHIDAPLHVFQGGSGIESYRLEDMIAPCRVLDFTHIDDRITCNDLKEAYFEKGEFVFLKTKNSYHQGFDFNFVFLDESGAEYLAGKKVRGVGIDALGIEHSQPDYSTHKILLKNNIVIIEGLVLKDIQPGYYTVFAAPINLVGAEAAPARVLLFKGASE